MTVNLAVGNATVTDSVQFLQFTRFISISDTGTLWWHPVCAVMCVCIYAVTCHITTEWAGGFLRMRCSLTS